MKKKILFIINHFIPYYHSLGGMIRVLSMIKDYSDKGYEIYVVTKGGNYCSYYGYEDVIKNINITYINDKDKLSLNQLPKQIFYGGNILRKFLREIKNEVFVPDEYITLIPKYLKTSIDLINQNLIKNVIISTPPHSLQIIGFLLKIKLKNQINLIADYRDSWNSSEIFRKRNIILQKINEYLESKVLKKIDHLLYVSPPQIEKLLLKHSYVEKKSSLLLNGFETPNKLTEVTIGRELTFNKGINIGYFGSISFLKSSFRNLEILKEALPPTLNKACFFHLFGNIQIPKKNHLQDSLFIYHGYFDHFASFKLMEKMDYLLVYHSKRSGSDEVITGKLFEYMFVKKPIIVVGPKEMFAKDIVEEFNLGITVDLYDNNEVKFVFNELIYNYKYIPKSFDINQYSRNYQNKLLERYLV